MHCTCSSSGASRLFALFKMFFDSKDTTESGDVDNNEDFAGVGDVS